MAMNADTMGAACLAGIIAAYNAAGPPPDAVADPNGFRDWWFGFVCKGIATGVIAHIQAAATVTIRTTDTALQVSTTAGTGTQGPITNKTLPGGCIG